MFPRTACTSSTFGNTSVPGPGLEREEEKSSWDVSSLSRVTFALFVVASSCREKPWENGTLQGPSGY